MKAYDARHQGAVGELATHGEASWQVARCIDELVDLANLIGVKRFTFRYVIYLLDDLFLMPAANLL